MLHQLLQEVAKFLVVRRAFVIQFGDFPAETGKLFRLGPSFAHFLQVIGVSIALVIEKLLLMVLLGRFRYLKIREGLAVQKVNQGEAKAFEVVPATCALEIELVLTHENDIYFIDFIHLFLFKVLLGLKIQVRCRVAEVIEEQLHAIEVVHGVLLAERAVDVVHLLEWLHLLVELDVLGVQDIENVTGVVHNFEEI